MSCTWPGTDPLYLSYHDREWGVPVRDGRELWEHLVLDGQQAGLSWITILRKREGYRAAFHGFDPQRIAAYGEADIARLLGDPGIVRNKQKVNAVIGNARAYLKHFDGPDDFSAFLWGHVGGKPIVNGWQVDSEIPAQTPESAALSAALYTRGFRFVGPVIVYAFMQAVGMVNDHVVTCPRHRAVREL
jgi:DNA-3-methyladenine glycosylase I